MSGRLKRFLATASLLVIGITETAPHRHADSLELPFADADMGGEIHVIRCDGATAGVPHLHPDGARQVDPCLACFRQHMQATALKVVRATPQTLQQFLTVTARVAHAHAVRLRKSSRGPPTLAS